MNVIPPLAIGEGGAFARASANGTYYDRDGVQQTAPADVPRVTYNPADLKAPPYVLIEGAATNFAPYSKQLDNAYWLLYQVTVAANGGNGPDGITPMRTLTATVAGVNVVCNPGFPTGGNTLSAIFKRGSCKMAWLSVDNVGSAIFDLDSGTVTSLTGGAAKITPLGGGLFLCEYAYTAVNAAYINIGMQSTVVGDTIYVTDVQAEAGALATSRIPTTSATATRAADVVSGTGLAYSSAVETAPAVYAAGTTYAQHSTASVAGSAGLLTVYRSRKAGNLGNAPATSPTWWDKLGDTYQVYASGTTYALGDRVIDAVGHKVYESALAGNLGQALTNTAKWILIGPTNKWGAFDLLRNTATVQPFSTTVIFTPGARADAVALLGLVGDGAVVQVFTGATEVYRATFDLVVREVLDWYDYYFAAFGQRDAVAKFNVPPYSGAYFAVTVSSAVGDAKLGACVVGLQQYIGAVQYDAESDVLNFSTVTRDFAGGTSLMTPRRSVPKTGQQLMLDKKYVNRARALRIALGGMPAVWSGLDDDGGSEYFEALLILGFYKKFSINLKAPSFAMIGLDLEEI